MADSVSEYGSPVQLVTEQAQPVGLAVDSNGTLYWVNYGSGELLALSPGAATPRVLLTGLANPQGVGVDALGNVYFTEYARGTLSFLAPGATIPVTLLSGLEAPNYLSVDAVGNVFYIEGATCGDRIAKYEPVTKTRTILLSAPGPRDTDRGFGGVFIHPSGDLYYTTCRRGTIERVRSGRGTPEVLLAWDYTNGIAADAAGNVYFTDYFRGVHVLPVGSQNPITVATAGASRNLVAVDSAANVYYSDNIGGIIWKVSPLCRPSAPSFYLSVASSYGPATGTGWYEACELVRIGVPSIVDHQNGTRRVFVGWAGDVLSPDPQVSILMDRNHSVTATWKTQYYLIVGADAPIELEGQGWYDSGTTVELAVPTAALPVSEGSRFLFVGWSGDSSGDTPQTVVHMDGPKTARANWQLQHYVMIDSGGGMIDTASGWIDAGETITVTAQSPSNEVPRMSRLVFRAWAGALTTATPVVTLTMDAPKTVRASWQAQYYLQIRSTEGNPRGEGWYDTGTQAVVSVEPRRGLLVEQVFARWSGDLTSTAPEDAVLMDRPRTVIAHWRDDYTQLGVAVGLVGAGFGGYELRRRSRRGASRAQEPLPNS